MKFKYIGKCAKSEVTFQTAEGPLTMPYGEPVEVPDALAKKLSANDHFEAVGGDTPAAKPKGKGKGAGKEEDKSSNADDQDSDEAK